MTFDQMKEKVWVISASPLYDRLIEINNKIKEKTPGINKRLRDLSVLYGEPIPQEINVCLNYYPESNSQKGEPINNFVESGMLPDDFTDILYWISKPIVKHTDTAAEIYKNREEYADSTVRLFLHEAQHRFFQKDKYKQTIAEAETNPDVIRVMDKLGSLKGTYSEATNEIITCYLETYGKRTLEQTKPA